MSVKDQALLSRLMVWTKRQYSTGCLEWTGAKTQKGYGRIYCPKTRKMKRAHRLMWEALHGPIPDGMKVCHKCDNPGCVEGSHLFLGTVLDNNRDRSQKGRTHRVYGEEAPTSKYPKDVISFVRSRLKAGASGASISRKTGISPSYVSEIKAGKYRDRG